jgi:hypothetical protein
MVEKKEPETSLPVEQGSDDRSYEAPELKSLGTAQQLSSEADLSLPGDASV